MTDTEAKALALVNEIAVERGGSPVDFYGLEGDIIATALCRAIEREEATEARHAAELREQAERFSEAVDAYSRLWSKRTPSRDEYNTHFAPFILPAPDPLVEALAEAMAEATGQSMTYTDERDVITLRQALADRGYKIERIEQ